MVSTSNGSRGSKFSSAVSVNVCIFFSCIGILLLTTLATSLVTLVDVKAFGLRLDNGAGSSSQPSASGAHGSSGSHAWGYKDSATGPDNWGKLKVGGALYTP